MGTFTAGSVKCGDCPAGDVNDGPKGCTVWAPKSKAELKAAIEECLEKKDYACSKGPHGPIGSWDVSAVTDMSKLFDGNPYIMKKFNGDISKWDVSRVTNMYAMFSWAKSFNSDLSMWDVSSVTNMEAMFRVAELFDGDISKWDVS